MQPQAAQPTHTTSGLFSIATIHNKAEGRESNRYDATMTSSDLALAMNISSPKQQRNMYSGHVQLWVQHQCKPTVHQKTNRQTKQATAYWQKNPTARRMLAATAWLLHELLTATLRIATTYGVAEAEWALHQLTLLAFCIWHIVMVLLLALLMMVNICAAALHVHNLTGQHCLAQYSCCQGVKCVKVSAHIACDIVDCLTSNWHCVLALISVVMYAYSGHLPAGYMCFVQSAFSAQNLVLQLPNMISFRLQDVKTLSTQHRVLHPKHANSIYWRRVRSSIHRRRAGTRFLHQYIRLLACICSTLIHPNKLLDMNCASNGQAPQNRSQTKSNTHNEADGRKTHFGGGSNKDMTSLEQIGVARQQFTAAGREWLSSSDISNCISLLLYTKYPHATHQPAAGPAHDLYSTKGSIANFHIQFQKAAEGNFSQRHSRVA